MTRIKTSLAMHKTIPPLPPSSFKRTSFSPRSKDKTNPPPPDSFIFLKSPSYHNKMMAATKNFYPAPEDLELVSALMNMKAGVPHDRSFPISVLSPMNKRTASSLHRKPLAPSIPQSHFIMDRMKPPWGHPHLSTSVLHKQTYPIPMTKHTTTGKHVQIRENAVQNPPAYTPEQRKKALERFKEKKRRRNNAPGQIRYQVRKRLADTRPRHRGRFFKPKPAETPPVSSLQGKVVN